MLGNLEPDWLCYANDSNRTTVISAPTYHQPAKCDQLRNCSHITPSAGSDFVSMVEEWQLICDLDQVPAILYVIYLVGQTIGALLGGHWGDHFGRLNGLFLIQTLITIASVMGVAARTWEAFAVSHFFNGFFYGIIETTSLTLMMEFTNAKYRLIPNSAFQWSLAFVVISLVAALCRKWRLYIIFINLLGTPVMIGLLLFQESPRWLIVRGKLQRASKALSEVAHVRWNNVRVRIRPDELERLPRDLEWRPYSIYHLFASRPLAVQTGIQTLAMITYSLVGDSFERITIWAPGGIFVSIALFGALRLWVPFAVIWLDIKVEKFGRKMQFLSSLGFTGVMFGACIVLMAFGFRLQDTSVVLLTILADVMNASAYWISVLQITASHYPTVVRCIAFGAMHAVRHITVCFDVTLLRSLREAWPLATYVIPEVFILITFVSAVFLQPETKRKELHDLLNEEE